MIVFWEQNLVVLSVPKTGTVALEVTIGGKASLVIRRPPALKHMPVGNYKRFIRPMDRELDHAPELMAVIREPVDWLGSWYRYRHRDALTGHPNSTRGVTFDGFVRAYISDDPPAFADVGSQFRFVSVKNGTEIGVDHLFRYEAQEAIRGFLQERLGFTFDLPRRNVSDRMPLTLSPDVERALRAGRPEEFTLWEQARTTAQPTG